MLDRHRYTLVRMTNMPYRAEPAYVYTQILGRNSAVKEIELANGGFYCYVDTAANAQSLAARYNDHGVLTEYAHAFKKICVAVISMTEAPEQAAVYQSLSAFLRTEREMTPSKTVHFRQLPDSHPVSAVMEMSEKCFEWAYNIDEEYYLTSNPGADLNPHYEHLEPHWKETGDVLARFSSTEAAKDMVTTYNGTFWKNDVVYAEFVDDREMDGIFQAKMATGPTAKLFIPKVKPGATKIDVGKMFAPHEPQDVQMQPGKNFAFVFMPEDTATVFLQANPGGKRHNGWFWVVKYADDKRKKRGKFAPVVPNTQNVEATVSTGMNLDSPTFANRNVYPGPKPKKNQTSSFNGAFANSSAAPKAVAKQVVSVRVTGIPRNATEEHLRDFFLNYPVEELSYTQGQGLAVVKIQDAQTAEEAQLMLNNNKNHKICGKKVTCVIVGLY